MIVKIHKSGFSFKGTADYLAHDPKARTQERLGWTHTVNLANDHVLSAVDEMVWTARNAELLKLEAGVHAGGSPTAKTVKHFSLNWAPGEDPSREHMIETVESYLRHMKWQEHQAVVFNHTDKPYAHVHGMVNVVHPETGLRLDDSFERRRAQAWALEYERANGLIHCEQRLQRPEDREKSMPRNMWTEFRENENEFKKDEAKLRADGARKVIEPENIRNSEWEILKQQQRLEREQFFAAGKLEFSAVRNACYMQIREEYSERWAAYYSSKKAGADPAELAATKKGLAKEQADTLKTRREEAFALLREARDERYHGILGNQRDARSELRWRQKLGLDNADFLQRQLEPKKIESDFRNAASWVGRPEARPARPAAGATAKPRDEPRETSRGYRDPSPRVGRQVGSFIGGILETLLNFDRSPPAPEKERADDTFKAAAEETLKAERHRMRAREEDERAQRLSLLPREQ